VKAKAVGQSAAKVDRYWTKARMRNATPLDAVRGQAKKKAAYAFTRYEAPAPYDARHGKVFFSDGGANYVCSGTAITSGNESVVWTAGHCVNEGPGGFYTNWAFVPAYRDGAAPYGTFAATRLQTTAGWGNSGDFSYDLGAATVGLSASGATLTDTVGGRGLAFNYDANQRYLSHGYPAAAPFTGGRMYICDAQLATRDSGNPQPMGIGCDMTGGSSGGGWTVNGSLESVNSYGYSTLRNVMFGPYQGTVSQSLYTQASSG
jgi:V8-like Glu-specific endopeptidase